MKLDFICQSTILSVDFDKKKYCWTRGLGLHAVRMPTIKEIKELEKKLLKEGFSEVE